MRDCHDCTFESLDERNAYYRCLVFYGQGIAIEKIKDGLIGRCDKYKPANPETVNTVAHNENSLT